MRRTVFALASAAALSLAVLAGPPALATGHGGWNHVGVGNTPAGSSLNDTVTALNTDNPGVLYVGGSFTSAGGNSNAQRIAKWDGSHWTSLGATPITNGGVFAIAYHAGKVYVGGTFQNAGGQPDADFLAVYDGTSWAPFCTSTVPGPAFDGNVDALQVLGNTLYVGGSFQDGAGIEPADYLLACDLTTGTASATTATDGSISGSIYALTADSNGTLYAGGQFINLDAIPDADHVAAYDGAWHAMGNAGPAIDSSVRSLTAVGENVYVGTDSVNINGIALADHIARWDGSAWSAVGSNTAGTDGWFATPTAYTIDGLGHYGSIVFAIGSFQDVNGNAAADGIAYFDGTQWRPIGSDGAGNGPWVGHGVAVGISGGWVYAGGNFTSAGGDTRARGLAAYDLRLSDALIGGSSTVGFAGNNVYSSSGNGETRTVKIRKGTSKDVYVKIQNDGIVPASFTVSGLGGANGIAAHYFAAGTNVTAAVGSGTYATPLISPRANVVLRMHVVVSHHSADHATLTTKARPASGTPPDAVRAVVQATG